MFVSELEKAFIPLFKKYFDLFQNAQFGEQVETILDRLKYLERIKADIKKEQKQAKKVIINKKNQVIADLRKNILNHICNGEHFNAIIHQIKVIVVRDLVFYERHIENLKAEVRQDIKMELRNDILNSAEFEHMKKDLKAQLLQELREQARVCFAKAFPAFKTFSRAELFHKTKTM